MRLRNGRITKREVRKHTRKYVRRMAIPRNNNREQPSTSTRAGIVTTTSAKPIPSIASTTTMPSTKVTPLTMQEGMIFPLQSPRVTQWLVDQLWRHKYRPFAMGFRMPILGREQPYGIPTSMMESLHINPSTFTNNTSNTYSQILAFGSVIGNHGRTIPP